MPYKLLQGEQWGEHQHWHRQADMMQCCPGLCKLWTQLLNQDLYLYYWHAWRARRMNSRIAARSGKWARTCVYCCASVHQDGSGLTLRVYANYVRCHCSANVKTANSSHAVDNCCSFLFFSFFFLSFFLFFLCCQPQFLHKAQLKHG